jgi:hypothetical protein
MVGVSALGWLPNAGCRPEGQTTGAFGRYPGCSASEAGDHSCDGGPSGEGYRAHTLDGLTHPDALRDVFGKCDPREKSKCAHGGGDLL